MKRWRLHFYDGRVEIITGKNFSEAYKNAGYKKKDLDSINWIEEIS